MVEDWLAYHTLVRSEIVACFTKLAATVYIAIKTNISILVSIDGKDVELTASDLIKMHEKEPAGNWSAFQVLLRFGGPAAHPGEHDRLSRFIVTAFPARYAYKTLAFVPKIRL